MTAESVNLSTSRGAVFAAGIRPFREESYRIEAETRGDKLIVHDYGHGGAGITLAWGSAHEVREIVRAHVAARGPAPVAVLGAGIMGLTAARVLSELGLKVSVHAKGFLSETTSHVAGGQFAPSGIAFDASPKGLARFEALIRRSFEAYEALIGRGYGVERRDNFAMTRPRSLEAIPRDLVGPPEHTPDAPFPYRYRTLLVEPPVFLRRLEADLRETGVPFVRRELRGIEDVLALDEPILVNALGAGAGAVFDDPLVVPVRGQLVLLPPQPALRYLYQAPTGYVFPRSDAVVVGGSFERGVSDPTPDPAMCRTIIETVSATLRGDRDIMARAPAWLLDDD